MVEDLLNLNDDLVTTANIENIDQATTSRQAAVASKVNHTEEIETDASEIKATHSHQNVAIPETEHEENLVTMSYKALNEILTENSALQGENKILKESLQRFENRKYINIFKFVIFYLCANQR